MDEAVTSDPLPSPRVTRRASQAASRISESDVIVDERTRLNGCLAPDPDATASDMHSGEDNGDLHKKRRPGAGSDDTVILALSKPCYFDLMPSVPIYIDNGEIYHERQSFSENGCMLHAFNNAVGYQALTCDQLDSVLVDRVRSATAKGVDPERVRLLGTVHAKLWSLDVFHQAVMKYTPFKLVRCSLSDSQLANLKEERMFIISGPRITVERRKELLNRKRKGLKMPRPTPARALHYVAVRCGLRAVIDSFRRRPADVEYGVLWSLEYIGAIREVVRQIAQ